ncbi:MAG TPA: DUF2199 domain-containing protein [Myxococcales bacterium]|nr:DUF2199 domain-containing protein [Myxococcales bacterium]
MPDDFSLDDDARWRRLKDREWTCSGCGVRHAGLIDLACGRPAPWPGGEDKVENGNATASSHFLSEDFCVLEGQHYFVRCILPIPILGSGGLHFAYGVWSTLSEKNFRRYVETFDTGNQGGLGPWFGWFSNQQLYALNGHDIRKDLLE